MSEKTKMPPSCVHTIAVEGVIGAGKTNLSNILSERFNARLILEEAEENPFLAGFYRNREMYAFQVQLWFLMSRYKQLSDELSQQDLFHEITVSDYFFQKDGIFARVNLDEAEYSLYSRVASVLEKNVPTLDLVVYLQASTDVLMKRIEKRGRPFEFNMDRRYIDQLNEAYNDFFFHYTDSPLLIINTDEIDFVLNEGDREDIIDRIIDVRPGCNFYKPPAKEDQSLMLKKMKKMEAVQKNDSSFSKDN
jgi:deoxyguanosine kinase